MPNPVLKLFVMLNIQNSVFLPKIDLSLNAEKLTPSSISAMNTRVHRNRK